MDDKLFIKNYLKCYSISLNSNGIDRKLIKLKDNLLEVKKNHKKVIIAGNGGSASLASHVSVDFTKQGKIRTINFNEPDLITCFANDYGYDNWLSKCIEFYSDSGDHVILISSSGKSSNIINAAKEAKNRVVIPLLVLKKIMNSKLSNFSFW